MIVSTQSHLWQIFPKNRVANQENIRNLIFKGYIIPFVIGEDEIEILGIYKHNVWEI